ncbi:MAG: response regulator transcription factor [Armatimonadota bacterium]|nr:response regulator transcription factor [Armatimonadota bacterium]
MLLVEDDADLAAAIGRKFSSSELRLLHTPLGGAALELVRTRQPDLMILDLMLPDMPGEQVLVETRGESNIPVIIISAKADEPDRINGLQTGADDYVTKPLSLSELLARVEALLRRSRIAPIAKNNGDGRPTMSALSFGGIEVLLSEREARLNGELLDLSPTEFKLLRLLVERGGSAVSAERIVDAVWKYDGYDRHIVETNIYRLRKKIEDDPANPQRLVTVRGFGYKLTSPDEA